MILAFCIVGCGETAEYEVVAPATLKPGDNIPMPAGEIVLTISGDISNTNDNETITLDIESLEAMGLVSYEVDDPWEQERVAYTGVLLSDLLQVAGASDSTTEIFATALDGYEIPIPIGETEAWPVLIATQSNGSYMSIESSGPTRIIFPFERHDDVTAARNMSVWNLESLEIR